MRWMIRLAAGGVVLLGGLSAVLLLALPRYFDTPEFHRTVHEVTTHQLGRPLRYDDLTIGLIPPRVDLIEPRLAGGDEDDPNFLEARSHSLRLAILPLLTGTIEIVSVVLDGVQLSVVLDEEGVWLPGPVEAEEEALAAELEESEDAVGFDIAIRYIELRDSTLRLVDRRVEPPRIRTLEALSLRVSDDSSDGPLQVEGSARLGTGGALAVEGTATRAGEVDLRIELSDWVLGAIGPYLGEHARLDASLDGEIVLLGPPTAPKRLAARLLVNATSIAFGDVVLRGPVGLNASLAGDIAALAGDLELDASAADLDYAGAFVKPAQMTATAKGRFDVREDGSIRVDLSSLRLHTLDAKALIESSSTTRIRIDAPPLDLAGFEALAPALEGCTLAGDASIEGLDVVLEPLRVEGSVAIRDVHLRLPDAEGISLQAQLTGRGDGIALENARVSAGGQAVAVRGGVRDLAGEMPFEIALESVGVLRANPISSALGRLQDVVYGPLSVNGQITGRVLATGSDTPILDSLAGRLHADLGESAGDGKEGGRIVGLSVLDRVIGAGGGLGAMTKLTSVLSGGVLPDLGDYMGDEFEQISGDFEVGDGLLRTHNLQMLYRSYGVDLKGTVGLLDQALDMTGRITLGDEIVDAFGARIGSDRVEIPIAHVGGTLPSPEFSVHESAFGSLVSRVLIKNPLVQGTVGKAVEGADQVLPDPADLLGGGQGDLLGGGSDDTPDERDRSERSK